MLPKTPMLDAVAKGNFAEAEELLRGGERLPAQIHYYDLNQLYEKLITKKAFGVLNALVATKQIKLDIYELDRLEDSIFKPLLTKHPVDEESLGYLKTFLSNVPNLNEETGGKSLLSYAFDERADVGIIKTLIAAGCRVDLKNTAEDNLIAQVVRINMMPLDKQRAYLELLINEGVSVDDLNVAKQSALHIAVERDKSELVDILLAHGGQPNEQDNQGNTAFFYALAHKFDGPLYNKLSAHTPPDLTLVNRNGQTALSEFLRMMSGSDSDMTLLEKLIDDGADLNLTTPYYNEAKSGWDWIIEKHLELLQMVLQKTGYDVNTQDNNGNTMLHKLCRVDSNYSHDAAKNTYRKVKFLLEVGADPSISNNRDETAMTLASTDNLKAKTVELLLSAKR